MEGADIRDKVKVKKPSSPPSTTTSKPIGKKEREKKARQRAPGKFEVGVEKYLNDLVDSIKIGVKAQTDATNLTSMEIAKYLHRKKGAFANMGRI